MNAVFLHIMQGFIVGIAVSAPLGPIGVLTMKRSHEHGIRAGIVAGSAVALIDTLGVAATLFGLTHLLPSFRHAPRVLVILGALLFFAYGIYLITKQSRPRPVTQPLENHFIETAALSLANPTTYTSFGIIALLMVKFLEISIFARIEVLVSFFCGALLWWTVLAIIGYRHGDRINMRHIETLVGIVIILLSIQSVLRFIGLHYSLLGKPAFESLIEKKI